LTARTVPLGSPGRAPVAGVEGAADVVAEALVDSTPPVVPGDDAGAADVHAASPRATASPAPSGHHERRRVASCGHGNPRSLRSDTVREPRSSGWLAFSAIRRQGRGRRPGCGAAAPWRPHNLPVADGAVMPVLSLPAHHGNRGARTAPAAGKAGIRPCPPSTRTIAAWGVVALLRTSMVELQRPRTYRLCQLFKVARKTRHLRVNEPSHLLGSTWVRTQSTISVVAAPGVNTLATPIRSSSGRSSSGMMPPPKTTMSAASR
jgi:hypothetical protein